MSAVHCLHVLLGYVIAEKIDCICNAGADPPHSQTWSPPIMCFQISQQECLHSASGTVRQMPEGCLCEQTQQVLRCSAQATVSLLCYIRSTGIYNFDLPATFPGGINAKFARLGLSILGWKQWPLLERALCEHCDKS